MILSETLIARLERVHSRPQVFVALIALLGTLLLGSSLIAWQSSQEQRSLAAAYKQTQRVLRSAAAVKIATLNMTRGERGYLLTGQERYLEPYTTGYRDLVSSLDDLARYTRDDAANREAIDAVRAASASYFDDLERVVTLARAGNGDEAMAIVRSNDARDGIVAINRSLDSIIESERARLRLLADHVERATVTLLRFIYVMSITGLSLLVLSVFSAIALRRSFARERGYREELRKKAETDELTGIANRRQLLTYLDHRIAEARRTGVPLSFALVDIDHFKRVNDTYGHGVGDEAIRHVVRVAQKAVRVNDMIGRLGGEEFGIVLPKSSEENAYVVCERLRTRLHELGFVPVDGQQVMLTISSGIACLTEEDDAASLIERADKALYEAKRSGRDQVKLAA